MPYTSLREVPSAVASLRPFKGNSIRGESWAGIYSVYSYNALILEVKGGEVTYLNNRRFSVTTSKHQNYIRRGLGQFPIAEGATILER